ncbi:MAG: hypothetical protein R3C61_22285 [Bacteroidia bacterium]
MPNQEIRAIKNHIAEGQTDQALEVIERIIQAEDLKDEIVLLKAKWNRGKEEFRKGIIQQSDWELLTARINHGILLLIEQIPNKSEVKKDKIVLFLYSNPNGRYDLGFDKEVDIIRSALERSRDQEKYGFIVEGGLTIDDLEVVIPKYNPTIIHFCVNSIRNGGNGLMIFEGSDGTEVEFTYEVFKEIMEEVFQKSHSTTCCVLNTCFSQNYGEILTKHLPSAVAMQDLTTGALPFEFSRIFYTNLFNGSTVESAFRKTVRGIRLNRELHRNWNIARRPEEVPVLLKRKAK